MDNETYAETRRLLVQAQVAMRELAKRESNYLSEDALTIKFISMTLNIMLVAWKERYQEESE